MPMDASNHNVTPSIETLNEIEAGKFLGIVRLLYELILFQEDHNESDRGNRIERVLKLSQRFLSPYQAKRHNNEKSTKKNFLHRLVETPYCCGRSRW